jgi:hypothetical protein
MSPEAPDTPATSSDSPAASPSPALLRATKRLLGPLVRLLLEHQVTFPVLTNLLKTVYIEQAERGFALPDRPQTISRLTLLTGIHRKDVKRLQYEAESEPPPATISLGAQLVLRWTAEPEYADDAGRPKALPRLAAGADTPSFESLVASVTQDIRPRAILDEWQRLGIARIDTNDHVHLAEEAFVPANGFDEKAYYLGRNVRDHLAAAHHNLTGSPAPFLERSVYYAHLRPESVQELQDLSREAGIEALQRVNRRARELQLEDEGQSDAQHRMSFGAWFFRARVEEKEAARGTEDGDTPDGGGSDAR